MRPIGSTPPTVPFGADQTVYIVFDRLGRGTGGEEAEFERSDVEEIVSDLMAGKFNDPVRIIAFNTLEHWSDDISKEVAEEIQTRCDIAAIPVPEHVRDFIEMHFGLHRACLARPIPHHLRVT